MQEPPEEPLHLDRRTRSRRPCSGRASTRLRRSSTRTAASSPPRSVAERLRPKRRPSRIACCAVGGASPPVVRSGTAAMSPAAQTSGTPITRRYSSTTIRPRSSTGNPPSPASGEGFTPAVHTSVSAANACPSDSRIVPPSADSRRVFSEHLDTPLPQLGVRVGRQVRRELGQDLPRRLDQDPSHVAGSERAGSCASRRVPGPRAHPAPRRPRTRRRRTRTSARRAGAPDPAVSDATSSRDSTWFRR